MARRKLQRWHAPAVALLLLHATLSWLNRAVTPGIWRDEAQYLHLSRALRQLNYQDSFLLGSPVHSQYPPGFPGLLALVGLPFGERPDVLLAAITLCSVAALALVYDLVRRCSGQRDALLVLLLSALNPELILHAGRLLSETPYLFWCTLALWAVIRERYTGDSTARGRLWPMLASASAILAALTRIVGATMLVALFFVWLRERRYRRVALLTAAGVLTVGSYLAWTVVAPEKLVGRSYVADATFSKLERPSFFAVVIDRATKNGRLYLTEYLEKDLPQPTVAAIARQASSQRPRETRSAIARADDAILVIATVVLVTFGVVALRTRAGPMLMYLAAYTLLLLVWPWSLARFLVPVLPFIHWMFVAGAWELAAKRRWLRPVPALVIAGIVGMATARNVNVLRDNLRCDRTAPESPGCMTEMERGYLGAMRFLRTTPDSVVVLTATDAQLGFFSGRRAVFPRVTGASDGAGLLAYMRKHRVEYALVTPLRPPSDQAIPWLRERCAEFDVAREFAASTMVLRVRSAETTPRGDACAPLERYARNAERSNQW